MLTDRETDVLKLLVEGNANKEIADKLNISTHTVISHRKNISQKTGIKSVSGLTIYAVVKNIINIDSYME
jgi:DNA-binding CsgD family transcriptional regulator